MKRIGLIINPVAGMGGSVGLKGTDGNVEEARTRGAVPHALDRARMALAPLARNTGLHFVTCSGAMGQDVLQEAGCEDPEVIYTFSGESSARDTKEAARRLLDAGIDLLLFCGGDGTARDIFSIVGRNVPLLGIPAGVKMYSGVFAVSPAAAAELVTGLETAVLRDSEVMDVDEEAYRAGTLETRLYGIARTPVIRGMVQVSKQVYEQPDEERVKGEIAQFMQEVMLPGALYIIGAGTTTEAIIRYLGLKKTLLGVDVVKNGRLLARDADEKTLLRLTENESDVRIIISPIGAQGFILGRGNQQISATVVRRAGTAHIIVVATPHKLQETPELLVDTGDPDLDRMFGESIQVICGYRLAQRKKIHQPDGQ
ncbi:ATP-NAD kinase family protein [Methanoregula sp.]|uniref:ATP-NAD kinase family protein n=1 Tax=Methanoregula sp. TaxID=2052170 RepID=UPI00236AAA71|nr:ATP-NAD kinase family protein [Methanoregula sp.]MDD1686215.1 ATP-NAD kinase family protein [Methanoregula sp.]